jgi:hypothetical protein
LLVELDARLRGVGEDVPFTPDASTLAQLETATLVTSLGNLDLLFAPVGGPGYAMLRRRAAEMAVEGMIVRVAAIDDLIEMKRAVGRAQDVVDLESLEIARLRRREKAR